MHNRFEGPEISGSEDLTLDGEILVPTMEKSFIHSIGDLEELFPSLSSLDDEF